MTKDIKKHILIGMSHKVIALSLFFLFFVTGYAAAKPVTITFSADTLKGSGAKNRTSTSLIGNAKVTVDALTIYGERIELSGKDYRYIKATGNVKGGDSEKGFSFSSESLYYDREKQIAEFSGTVKLEDTKNKVETTADRIVYNQKNETMLMQMQVTLKSKDMVCTAFFALYYRNSSVLELTGKPIVKKDKDEFKAARITVNTNTEDIKLEGKVSGSVTDEKKKKSEQSQAKEADIYTADEKEQTSKESKNTDNAHTDETQASPPLEAQVPKKEKVPINSTHTKGKK